MAESCLDMFCQADRDCNLLWHWSTMYWIGEQGQSSWISYELWSLVSMYEKNLGLKSERLLIYPAMDKKLHLGKR